MKIILFLFTGLTILLSATFCFSSESIKSQVTEPSTSDENLVRIISSPELAGIVTKWTDDYSGLNKNVKFNVSTSVNNNLITQGNIYFVEGENNPKINDESIWKMKIGSNVVVPIMNKNNPAFKELTKKGITSEKLKLLFTESDSQNWQTITDGTIKSPIHLYIAENENILSSVIAFSGIDPLQLKARFIRNSAELISLIKNDINAVGFCKLTDIIDAGNNSFISDIGLIPIDKNKNAQIDNFENIYSTPSAFIHGVWIKKYPVQLSSSIYAVSSSKPTDTINTAFLTWISSEGQKHLSSNGICYLSTREKESNLALLNIPKVYDIQNNKPINYTKIILLLFVIISIAGLAMIIYFGKRVKYNLTEDDLNITPALNENSIKAPSGLFFDKTHTWAFMEKDGVVKVGIDDFLQHVTGKITRITMKKPGEKIRKGESIVTIIRDGKHLTIYSPVTGIIKHQNSNLLTDSSLINTSTFDLGWIYEIVPKNWLREIQFMFMSDKYKEWIADEFVRLKEFFSISVNSNQKLYNQVVLQDGGELSDNMLADFDPEVWDDFQTHFIDTSK